MSFTTDLVPQAPLTRPEKWLLGILAFLAICLRFYGLRSHPAGYDLDEAGILFWAHESWRQGQFWLYGPEQTRWEMVPGWIHAFIGHFAFGLERLSPALMGCGEAALFGWLVRGRWGPRAGVLAATLLLLCPWHFFYARIIGTCVGVLALDLLVLKLLDDHKPRVFAMAAVLLVGLFYYTTFRVMFGLVFLLALRARDGRRVAAVGLAGLAALGLLALSASSFSEFLTRGTYNFRIPQGSIPLNYFFAGIAPFVSLPAAFRQITPEFLGDYVHTGFIRTLGSLPPLGFALGALSLFGAGIVARDVFQKRAFRPTTWFLFPVVMWLVVGFMGPSLSRLLVLAPFWLMLATLALLSVQSRWPRAYVPLLAAVGLFSLFEETRVLRALGNREVMAPIFHHRYFATDTWMRANVGADEAGYLFADDGFPTARWLAYSHQAYRTLPPVPAEHLDGIFRFEKPEARAIVVVLDEAPADSDGLSTYDQRIRLIRIRDRLPALGFIEQAGDVTEGGQVVAKWYRLRLSGR